jgi:molybdenum-dependent DNA-binding transcriptional regulator ModE
MRLLAEIKRRGSLSAAADAVGVGHAARNRLRAAIVERHRPRVEA